jgi:polar amino acid transport system permease protein
VSVQASPQAGTRHLDNLSPAPPSRPLALAALAAAILTVVAIAVVGGAAAATAVGGTILPGLLSTAGVVAAVVVLWFSIRAITASNRAGRMEKEDKVLQAREHASKSREHSLISLGLLVALWTVVGLVIFIGMNDGSIQKTFLRWDVISASFVDVLKAFGLNIFIAVVAQALVLFFGLVLAVARIMPGRAGRPVRAMAIAYIDIMRAVPAIIVLYLVGFGLPLTGLPIVSEMSPVWFAILALALTYSAYVAEIYRAGIETIHTSQQSAARSLGLSYPMTLRHVILPQAVRSVIPPLLGTFIALQKDTSLVNIIGTMDAFNQAKFYAASSYNLSSVTVVAALFVLITIPQTRLVDGLLAKSARKRGAAK